jgi:hypothetical protein
MRKNKYTNQVFINCPFDIEYAKLFQAIVFTIQDCGFIARCSKEIDNATELRLDSIINLINQCKYGVHDLSRIELDETNRLPRFNMPFELGIFYGAKKFGTDKKNKSKSCIIFEKEQYSYQIFISDISGIDIKNHDNLPKKIIFAIRNWLSTSSNRITIPYAPLIFSRYGEFYNYFKNLCNSQKIDCNSLPFIDLTRNISDWLKLNPIEST